jgi:uncharacterized membrane protein YdjX (TVP38/TMEM64 family)
MFTAGAIAAAGFLFLLFKFGVKRVISYDIIFDVLITTLLVVVLWGTFSGMMAALFGGLIVSVILFTLKRVMKREELAIVSEPATFFGFTFNMPKVRWVSVEPGL